MATRLKVAELYATELAGVQVAEQSDFSRSLEQLVVSTRPLTVIETGTFHGTGTTAAVCRGLTAVPQLRCLFYSIEINAANYGKALESLQKSGLLPFVHVLNGLSLPRTLLLSKEAIRQRFVDNYPHDGVFVDHPENVRVERYFQETAREDAPDDLLDICLQACNYKPDIMVLDSAGHLGFIEFQYVLPKIQGSCFFALDDTCHVKHCDSLLFMRKDTRFTIVKESEEKFGFCIAKFTPAAVSHAAAHKSSINPSVQNTGGNPFREYMKALPKIELPDDFSAAAVNRLLYLRMDGIGDTILANSLLEKLPDVFPDAKISVVCDQASAAIYEACPLVDDVMPLKKNKLQKQEYFNQATRLLNTRKSDVVLHALASPTPYAAALALSLRIPVIGLEADTCNMAPDDRAAYNEKLAIKVAARNDSPAELKKYEDILAQLGAPASMLQPKLWLTEQHYAEAKEIWDKHGLVPERTITVFSKGDSAPGYAMFGHALLETCRQNGWSVAALGAEANFELNEENLCILREHDISCVNLSGAMGLLTCSAFLSKCRLAVGVDTSLAHIACALNVPQVIALGGGFPGRFIPQHSTTTGVCLPLECWGCNWRCQYGNPHCVSGITPGTLAEAIESALSPASPQTGYGRILMQAPLTWKTKQGKPRWRSPDRLIRQQKNEETPIAFSVIPSSSTHV